MRVCISLSCALRMVKRDLLAQDQDHKFVGTLKQTLGAVVCLSQAGPGYVCSRQNDISS